MFGEINAIRLLATKYSKQQLANLAQTGQIEPQKAVMAGMMIDRIAKSAMAPPQTTVAQDVLGQAPIAGQMPPGQMPPQAMQGQPPQMPPQMAADGGLMGMLPQSHGVASLHSGLHDMAGGGIVAFAGGGDIPGYAGGTVPDAAPQPMYLPNNIDLAKGNIPIYRTEAPKEVTLSSAAEQQKAADTQAGLDPKFYENLKTDVLKDKEDFAKQKDEAKGMAALQFGLGLMGARKGQEFQTASTAGQQALAQYGSTLKDIKLSEKEMKKDLRQLTMAEQAYKQSNSDKNLAKVDTYQNKFQDSKENYTKALNKGVADKIDLFKSEKQTETSRYVADTGKSATLGAADISAKSHEKVAGMKGAEERMFDMFHQSELGKNPNQTPMETYEKMKTATNKPEAFSRMALEIQRQWDTIQSNPVSKSAFEEANPEIKTLDQFTKYRMGIAQEYYGRPGAGKGTPPPSDRASSSAAATDALPMPANKADAIVGKTYNTPRGPAKWNGTNFVQ
jgi:hypothetical protein